MNADKRTQIIAVVMGPQGSGKGTQTRLLQEEFDFTMIEMGAILRDRAKKDKEIDETLKAGKLVSDLKKKQILAEVLEEITETDRIAFDGFPRSPGDAETFIEVAAQFGWENIRVVHLKIDDELAVERIHNRSMCTTCGRIYSSATKKLCNNCGGKVEQRKDSSKEAVRQRLEWHHEIVEPVIMDFVERYSSVEIDASQEVSEVHKEVIEFLGLTA